MREAAGSVGFIGLGSQGAPMARRILDAGFPLTLWARRSESLQPFAGTAVRVADSPAQLGSDSWIVGICVTGDHDVDEVLLGGDGVLSGMRSGGVVVVHSTVHPETCVGIAERASERGIGVLDAPVSGGGPAAALGKLLVMVGGDEEVLVRARPVLATFGDPILHLGPLGTGQTAKLVNNLVFTAQVALALDAYSFGDELGLDRAAMAQVLERGSGASRAAAIVAGGAFDLSGLAGAASLLRKDVGLLVDLARKQGITPPPSLLGLAQESLTTLAGTGRSPEGDRHRAQMEPRDGHSAADDARARS